MKFFALLALSVVVFVAAGCGGTAQKSVGSTGSGIAPSVQLPTGGTDFVVPPDNAQWTIACVSFSGYGHVERAKTFKQQIIASTGLSGFYVLHEDNVSTLYYGYYRFISERDARDRGGDPGHSANRDDLADGNRAQHDLTQIKSLTNAMGDRLFTNAQMSPLEPADPVAPAAWNLKNLDRDKTASDPTRAFWSLEIAIYKDSPQRKQAAVDSVKALRDSGVSNAYFYHGATASSVCIGAWPESAIKEQEMGNAQSVDSDTHMLVLAQPLPQGASNQIFDSEGHKLRTLEPKLEPVDPTMIDTMRRYPRRSVNGYDIQHTYTLKAGGTTDVFDPSLVIIIPRETSKSLLDRPEQTDSSAPPLLNGSPMQGGRLRSLP